ncbi:MAG: helix-turn-helix domain-containing protein [Patescibacteria group bacterium]|jgi:sugar-specific transcriptional regulator TrmB
MKDASPILRSLGLLDSEIKTYLAALERGPSPALDLAKHAKLSRQAIYLAIDSLTERGLMSSFLRGKKRFYASEEPGKLLSYAKRHEAEIKDKIADLERLLPDLELQAGGEKPIVKVFEGKEGLKSIIEDIQGSAAKESYEISDLEALYKVLTAEDLKEMRLNLKHRGRRVRGIYAGKATGNIVQSDRKYLPLEKGGFKANIGIYGNRIVLVTFEGKMYSVIVDSKPLARALWILFEYAFQGLGGKH